MQLNLDKQKKLILLLIMSFLKKLGIDENSYFLVSTYVIAYYL